MFEREKRGRLKLIAGKFDPGALPKVVSKSKLVC